MTVSHCFKHFEVRPDSRVLLIGNQPADIGSRAFDLLLLLIEHRYRVLTKQELLAKLWPGMVVEENNLQIHVSALRKLLGPETITTVQGRGYRFALEPVAPAPQLPSTLPTQTLPLCGRESELQQLVRLLADYPLVTVVGPGGIGKTSIALAAARTFGAAHAADACWVDLARLPPGTDEAQVVAAIAHAVALPVPADGTPQVLAEVLRERSGLLVLDNAEHVLPALAACLHALLGSGTRMRLLVTSQAPLCLADEFLFRLEGLPVPPDGVAVAEAMRYGAIALFVERARAVERRFALSEHTLPTVIAICRQLDGLPLALRLAVSRLSVLGLDGIAVRLQHSLKLLRATERQGADRQQTMEAALHWSFGLLSPLAQALFCRLGLFIGGFWLEAAEEMGADLGDGWCVIEQLQELVERSMLQLEAGSETQPRYRMPECARQYAWMRLQQDDDVARWEHAHARCCLRLAEQAYDEYWRSDDESWLARYTPDLDNIRRALDWATRAAPTLATGIIGATGPLFMLIGLAPEARLRFTAAEPDAGGGDDDANGSRRRARYWLERSRLEWGVSRSDMLSSANRALEIYNRSGDRSGRYLALRCAAAARAAFGDDVAALLDEMAAIEPPNLGARARAQRLLTEVAACKSNGDQAAARDALDRLLSLGQLAGLDAIVCAALGGLAELSLERQDYAAAVEQADLLLARRHTHRGNFLLLAHGVQALAYYLRDEHVAGKAALSECARAARQRNWEWLGMHGETLALCAALERRTEAAAGLLGYADAARSRIGPRTAPAAEAWRRAHAICAATLSEDNLERLQAQGTGLDAGTACRLALGDGW